MSSPAQTSPAPPAPPTDFDPLVFWVQHRQKVTIFAGLFVAALLIYFASEYVRLKRLDSSSRALAEAKDDEGFRKVISDYSGTAAAGNAYLLLADKLRKEGKTDEAVTTLRTFIDKYSDHPLISGAWTSLAATQEAQGKPDEALSTYQKVSTTFATSFSAPVALLGQARIFKEKGKMDDARRLFEQVINQYPDSMFAQQAMQESQHLKK
ncbi:MAG: tetratricopeptide repeat protein [Chthoniobacteraceae bacterium]